MATVIAYVDGFNLYYGLHAKYRRRYLWLDLEQLTHRIRPRDRIIAVRYFTALVRDDPAALARQQTYLEALRVRSGGIVGVHLGRYQSKQYLSDAKNPHGYCPDHGTGVSCPIGVVKADG